MDKTAREAFEEFAAEYEKSTETDLLTNAKSTAQYIVLLDKVIWTEYDEGLQDERDAAIENLISMLTSDNN